MDKILVHLKVGVHEDIEQILQNTSESGHYTNFQKEGVSDTSRY